MDSEWHALEIGVTTTDPLKQPPKEWWDIGVSVVWAEETLKRHRRRFEKLEPQWRALVTLLEQGEAFRRFAAPGVARFDVASGFVIIRSEKAIATLALPELTMLDRITSHVAPRDWLGELVSADVIAADCLGEYQCQAEWDAMRSLMQQGDEIRRFSNGAQAFQALCGRAGFALVRNGEVIASFVTLMN